MTVLNRARTAILLAAATLAGACELPEKQFSGNEFSRLHADFVRPGSHRLAQAGALESRADIKTIEIMTSPRVTVYDSLIANGVNDEDIVDGSVGVAITVCCGGGVTGETRILYYAPPSVDVRPGDVIEVLVGESPDIGAAARPNTALRVRASGADGKCRWIPEDPGLWSRVLYCEGLEEEGWVTDPKFMDMWILPPTG